MGRTSRFDSAFRQTPHVSATKRECLIIFSYFILAVLSTYPLLFKLTSHVAYEGTNDAYYCLWSLWWSRTALFDLRTNPLYTTWLFYPVGTSVIFGPTQLHATAILFSPLQLLIPGSAGLIFTYNFVVFASLVVSAYGAYLLSHHVCHHRGAAFIAGIVYAFLPLRIFNIVRLQYFSVHWIPFFMLFFIKLLEEKRTRDAVLAAVFFALILFDHMGYAIHMIFFGVLATVVASLFRFPESDNERKPELFLLLSRLGIFVATTIIVTLPFTAQLAREMASNVRLEQKNAQEVTLSSLVTPHAQSTLYGRFVDAEPELPENPSSLALALSVLAGAKKMPFLRYSVILLFLCASYVILRNYRRAIYWPVIAVFFLLLSLGSRVVVSEDLILNIPTPYSVLRAIIPPLKVARTTMDYLFHFTLAAAVTSSVGLAFLSGVIGKTWKKNVTFCVVGLAVILESLIIPIKVVEPEVTPAYEIIMADSSDCAITELPMADPASLSRQFLYQTYHRKKLLGGLLVRASPETRKTLEHPFVEGMVEPLKHLQMPSASRARILEENRRFIDHTNLKYIVINRLVYRNSPLEYPVSLSDLERFLMSNGYVEVYSDKDETLYMRGG